MIKRENRLGSKYQVSRVLSKGKSVKSQNLSCRFLSNNGQSCRITVVVSKKVSAKATERNLIKRRVREAFGGLIGEQKGLSLVIFPKQSTMEADFNLLKQEAQECLKRVRQ